MPPAPGYLDKVNYIVDFFMDPCNAPLIVYIRLAKAPAGKAIITWFTFGFSDVLRGYARPSKALGGGRSARRGKRKPRPGRVGRALVGGKTAFRKIPGLGEDTGGFFGKHLPGARELKGRAIQQGELLFWHIDDIAQRALLALLITDIALDFAYELTTLVDLSEECQRQSKGSLYATGPGTAAGGIFICRTTDCRDLLWKEGDCDFNVIGGSVGPRGWNALSTMTVHNISAVPVTHYQQANILDSLGNRAVFSPTTLIQPGASDQSILKMDLVGPGSFTVTHCCFGGVVHPDDASCAIWGGGNRDL